MQTDRETGLTLVHWMTLMGRDLPKSDLQALQPVMIEDRRITIGASHVRYRFGPGSRVALCTEGNRVVLCGQQDGTEVEDRWHGEYEFALPPEAVAALPTGDAIRGMVVGTDEELEVMTIRVEEHPADVLGPRVVDEPPGADDPECPPALARHLVRGFGLDEWTPERVRELEDLVCGQPFARDPVAELADGDDWVGWKVRNRILRRPLPADATLRGRLVEQALAGQSDDGSWDASPPRTAYAILQACQLGVPADDPRLRRACQWLLEWPEPDGRPGMWMLSRRHLEEWNSMRAGDRAPECNMYLRGVVPDDWTAWIRADEQQQVVPTCARHFWGFCDAMLHPSATVVDALCRCGCGEHVRVRTYANTIQQVGGMFGYFCACWGINDFPQQIEDTGGAAPDFDKRTEDHAIALASLPYGYARDADDLCALAYDPNYPGEHRPNLADTNGWIPYEWQETGVEGMYAVAGGYWQNADCWAKTNRALSQIPGWPGTIAALLGVFQCHLYQTSLGEWSQGFPAGMLRWLAEVTRAARGAGVPADSPETRLAEVMVLKTVPWLRRHQGSDGLWDHSRLTRWATGEKWPAPGSRLATYHIASALHDFGVLGRLRPGV
jgi:hypothetical protein